MPWYLRLQKGGSIEIACVAGGCVRRRKTIIFGAMLDESGERKRYGRFSAFSQNRQLHIIPMKWNRRKWIIPVYSINWTMCSFLLLHAYFYKNNFIRTTRLKFAQKLRTSKEQLRFGQNVLVLIKKKACTTSRQQLAAGGKIGGGGGGGEFPPTKKGVIGCWQNERISIKR